MDYKHMLPFYETMMSESIAKQVKGWRVTEDYSFRKVHESFQIKYVDKAQWYINTALGELNDSFPKPHGRQADGAMLCELAMDYLKEDGFKCGWYEID